MQTKKCSCGKDLVFLRTARGKLAPVTTDTLQDEEIKQLNEGLLVMFNSTHHINHFSNCPDYKRYKK